MMTKQANKTEGLNGGNEMKNKQQNTQGGKTMKQTKGGKTVMNTMNNNVQGGAKMENIQLGLFGEQGGNVMETKVDPRVESVLNAINSETKGLKSLMEEINNPKKEEKSEEVKAEEGTKEAKKEKTKKEYIKREGQMEVAIEAMMVKEAGKAAEKLDKAETVKKEAEAVKKEEEAKIEALEAERARIAGILEAEGLLIEAQRLLRGEITLENYDSMVAKIDRAKYIIKSRLNKIYRIAEKKAEDRKARKEAKAANVRNYVGVVANKAKLLGEDALAKELLSKEVTIDNAKDVLKEVGELDRNILKPLNVEYKQLKGLVRNSDKDKTLPELRESVAELAQSGEQTVDGVLTEKEIKVFSLCSSFLRENSSYNKFAFTDKKNISRYRENVGGVSYIKEMRLKGFRNDLIERAFNEDFEFEAPVSDIDIFELSRSLESATVQEKIKQIAYDSKEAMVLHKDVKNLFTLGVKEDMKASYMYCYFAVNAVFSRYNAVITNIDEIVKRPESLSYEEGESNKSKLETTLKFTFVVKNLDYEVPFSISFPFIKADGFFQTSSSDYYCSYVPKNWYEYLNGQENRLILSHPLTYLAEACVATYGTDGKKDKMTQDEFLDVVSNLKTITAFQFENKAKRALRNSKLNKNDEDKMAILWVPKGLSSLSRVGRTNTVLIDTTYNELSRLEGRHIEGLDYLTGSTSLPAKRSSVASGYKIVPVSFIDKDTDSIRFTGDFVIKATPAIINKKPSQNPNIGDVYQRYCSQLNSIHPAFVKTGGKRNNGPTMSWAYNFVEPQRYERYVTNPICNLKQSTINSVLKTLFVAKIDLPATLSKKLSKFGLYPNSNDAFVLSDSTSKRMAALYAKAGKELKARNIGVGDKMYGVFRDKASVSAILRRYRLLVDYEVRTITEANELIKALKAMRGEDVYYRLNEADLTVTFEIDVIANPSIGRDNFGAIALQSALETRAMLKGERKQYTFEDVAKMDVEKELAKEIQSHHVYLVTRDLSQVKYDFGKVVVFSEDFFWQPQHSNADYIREKSISTFYNQGIAGLHTFTPTWHKYVLNSFNFSLVKQTLVALNLGYAPETNNVTSEKVLKAKPLTKDLVTSAIGFDEDDEEVVEIVDKVEKLQLENKLGVGTGVLKQFDPRLGVSFERVKELFDDCLVNKDAQYSFILTENEVAEIYNVLYRGGGLVSKHLRDLLWNNEKQCLDVVKLIEWINSKYVYIFEERGERRVAFVPFGSEQKFKFTNATEKQKESNPEFEFEDLDLDDDEVISISQIADYVEKVYDYNEGTPLDYKHACLLNLAVAHYNYENIDLVLDPKAKDKARQMFVDKVEAFENQLLKIFSKEWKHLYQWKMEGISGVALPSNTGIDGIELPKWYCKKHNIKLGDKVLVFRDPIQGLFLELEVQAIHGNEIRIHSTILTWLGGDHDGDKIQIVPVNEMIELNKEYIEDEYKLRAELDNIQPSKLLDNPNIMEYLAEKDLDFSIDREEYSNTLLGLLKSSNKSMKYSAPLEFEDFVKNYDSTILNMRTVKEGTAIAGAFCNKSFEIAELMGLDLLSIRVLNDRIQQLALDSKHTQGGNGFRDSVWYKLVDVFNGYARRNTSADVPEREVRKVLNGEDVRKTISIF